MAYHLLASRLSVVNGTDAFTPAVPNSGNAVQVDAVIFANTATSLSILVEGSNDNSNWSTITTNAGLTLGYSAPTKSTGVGFAWVRLHMVVVGTGVVIVAAGVNLTHQ